MRLFIYTILLCLPLLATANTSPSKIQHCELVDSSGKYPAFNNEFTLKELGKDFDGNLMYEIKNKYQENRLTFNKETNKGDLYFGTFTSTRAIIAESDYGTMINIVTTNGNTYGSSRVESDYSCN